MSDWAGIKKAVNSDLSTPLNHLIWLNDYKTFGEDSYVFQNKDILHELYRDYELCMNDEYIISEVLEYANSINEVGKSVLSIYGVPYSASIANIRTLDEAALSTEVFDIAVDTQALMNLLVKNQLFRDRFINDSTFVNHVLDTTSILTKVCEYPELMVSMTQSPLVITTFAKSTNSWEKKRPFVLKINESNDYVSNINTIVTNTSYFTRKYQSYLTQDPNSVSEPVLDASFTQYGTATYAKNGIILFSISGYSTPTTDTGVLAKVTVNDEVVKVITKDNVSSATNIPNIMAIPTALYYAGVRRYQQYSVYIAK